MPIYQFKCLKCETAVEKLRKHSDPAPDCEIADHGPMERQFSRPAFHFKDGAGTSLGLLWSVPDQVSGS